jgi:citronellol/citronellal dehydrogenase
VVHCGRREAPLARVRDEIESGGGECLDVATDVRDPVQVDRFVGAALERFGAIDVLVNNACGQFSAPAEEISER